MIIAEKLEIWINDEEELTATPSNLHWEYLGYITLSDNQSTSFKSRELKSVSVPGCAVKNLKIILSKNHQNVYNIHNQVSLIAINTLGTDLSLGDEEDVTDEPKTENLLLNNPEYSSPYDDLAFLMYVDLEVADIIREMELKKLQAVKGERFEYARKLKIAMESLREAGERLSKYELEKRHAIQVEDYDRARQKKSQKEDFRNQVYARLAVERLLETKGVRVANNFYRK